MRSSAIALFILAIGLAACGTDKPGTNNQGNGVADAGTDVALDASANSSSNNGQDASTPDMDDGPDDVGIDSGDEMDVGTDAGDSDSDATTDAGVDAAADAGMDASVDMGTPTYDTCEGAIDVTAGGTFTGTTVGETDNYGPFSAANGCPTGGLASGPEVVYSFTPTANTTYDLVVTPDDASYDPMLYILTDCANDSLCAAGTVLNGAGVAESLREFQAVANTTYYLIVDGEGLSSGAFTLEVTIQ